MPKLWGFARLFAASNDLHATIAVTNSPRTAHRGPLLGLASIRHHAHQEHPCLMHAPPFTLAFPLTARALEQGGYDWG